MKRVNETKSVTGTTTVVLRFFVNRYSADKDDASFKVSEIKNLLKMVDQTIRRQMNLLVRHNVLSYSDQTSLYSLTEKSVENIEILREITNKPELEAAEQLSVYLNFKCQKRFSPSNALPAPFPASFLSDKSNISSSDLLPTVKLPVNRKLSLLNNNRIVISYDCEKKETQTEEEPSSKRPRHEAAEVSGEESQVDRPLNVNQLVNDESQFLKQTQVALPSYKPNFFCSSELLPRLEITADSNFSVLNNDGSEIRQECNNNETQLITEEKSKPKQLGNVEPEVRGGVVRFSNANNLVGYRSQLLKQTQELAIENERIKWENEVMALEEKAQVLSAEHARLIDMNLHLKRKSYNDMNLENRSSFYSNKQQPTPTNPSISTELATNSSVRKPLPNCYFWHKYSYSPNTEAPNISTEIETNSSVENYLPKNDVT